MKNILAIALFAASVGTPCNPRPQPTPRPTLPPASTPTASPTHSIPTPIPPPAEMQQFTRGTAKIQIKGVSNLPLSPTSDNWALGVLTWEQVGYDRSKPVLELSIRGTSPMICTTRPCKDKAGLIVRYSANLLHDDGLDWSTPAAEHESQKIACGQGLNFHRRLAIGASDFVATVVLQGDKLTVSTPVDSATFSLLEGQLSAQGSLGFGRFIQGVPWPRKGGRSWLWNAYDATRDKEGNLTRTSASLLSWEAVGSQPELQPCPAM